MAIRVLVIKAYNSNVMIIDIIPRQKKIVNAPVKMIKPKSVRQGLYYKTTVQQYFTLARLTVTYSTKSKILVMMKRD